MGKGRWLIWGVYAVAVASFGIAIFVLLTFEASRYDPLHGGWTTPPWVIALGFAVYGIVALAVARYFRRTLDVSE
jgi:uncharacterized membrane protein YbhN (UPF0104 family)